jgi:peptidyl-prolyl cis-trans isomerase D
VISAAFGSDVGVDTDALQLPNGGNLWYDVAAVTPARERTLDEVKDQVATRWRDDEIATRLQAKADDMLGKLKAGTPLTQLASEAGLKVETAADLQRKKPAGFVAAKVVDAVFKTAKGLAGSSEGDAQTQRFVYVVTDVIEPKLDAASPEAKQLSTTLQTSYGDDIIGAYIAQLENDYGVTINQSAFNQVIGGGPINTGGASDY